jgi:hypothetical protein
MMMKVAPAHAVRPGLRENLAQFSLLVLVNAFVGGVVGLERTVVPLVATEEFRIGSEGVIFDGKPIAATLRDNDVWLTGWLASESTFIKRVTSQLPPTPPNFARIIEQNEAGDLPSGDPTDLEAGANRCGVR